MIPPCPDGGHTHDVQTIRAVENNLISLMPPGLHTYDNPLYNQLHAPRKPNRGWSGLVGSTMLILGLCLLPLVLLALSNYYMDDLALFISQFGVDIRYPQNRTTSNSPSLIFIPILLTVGGIFLTILGHLNYKKQYPRWQKASARWDTSWYCNIHGLVFNPIEHKSMPAEHFQRWLHDE